MNIHRILEQNLCQLLDGQVAGKGVLRPHQVPPLSLPGGSQVVDQLHLVRVLCMAVGAGDDGKILIFSVVSYSLGNLAPTTVISSCLTFLSPDHLGQLLSHGPQLFTLCEEHLKDRSSPGLPTKIGDGEDGVNSLLYKGSDDGHHVQWGPVSCPL